MSKFVVLNIKSDLQSWGYESLFMERTSLEFPTKSGILGLICSATGRSGEQRDFLSLFNNAKMDVFSLKETKWMNDYQLIGAGYDKKDDYKKRFIPNTTSNVIMTAKELNKTYLVDQHFVIILEIDDNIIDEIIEGLMNPVWGIHFGRKNCVPNGKILLDVFDDYEKAKFYVESNFKDIVFTVTDFEFEDAQSYVINDVPISFGYNKVYDFRKVFKKMVIKKTN